MHDLILRNGQICDGSGRPSVRGAVAIRDREIAAIIPEATGQQAIFDSAQRVVDVGGSVIAPGFIDPHTHYDAQLTWDGLATPSLEHGVTTVIPGNCSLSLAPLRSTDRDFLGAVFRQIEEMPKSAFDAGLEWTWETFGEYADSIRGDLGLNVAPLVGHSLLRLWVLGEESRNRPSTREEIAALEILLRDSLEGGALGLSTSFADVDHEFRPVPCRLAKFEELDALASVLGEFGRPLQALPEFWDADLLCVRIDQLADLSIRHQIPVTFSPLFESPTTPGLVERVLERLERQTARGARITAQMQARPVDMTFDMTIPSAVFAAMPTWFGTLMQGPDTIRAAFSDATTRAALVAESKTTQMPIALDFHLEDTVVSAAEGADRVDLGRTLGDIGRERGLDPAEVLMDIALAEDLQSRFTTAALAHHDETLIAPSLAHPQVQIGAGDGGAHVARFATYGDTGHFIARFVRARNAFTLEEGVKRLTADVAEAWGLERSGRIEEGQAADLVVFDPETIDRGPEELAYDLPDGGESFRFIRKSRGIQEVVVGGETVYTASEGYTDSRRGEIVS